MEPDRQDEIDRALLDIIQTGFPLDPRPYRILGEQTGISEAEAFQRVSILRKNGVIRRIGANFQSAKLGFVSTLCAAKVPSDRLDHFIDRVNSIPGVTHNYERENEYNIWFTLIAESREQIGTILAELERETGIPVLDLPASRLYKIRVDFPMTERESR